MDEIIVTKQESGSSRHNSKCAERLGGHPLWRSAQTVEQPNKKGLCRATAPTGNSEIARND
ncbi:MULTISPECIES: hypothetical protein, partial [Bradyrhizobium]|uniref:hypothetical protein n=1 Tax=Bradyrhizobium TaxID=374 RepID=UPI001E4F1740